MQTYTNENDPAFPTEVHMEGSGAQITLPGLTAREHAAIHLRVPMSGNAWLDAMITEARRWDAAQAAMPSYYDQDRVACISNAVLDANSLTHQMKGGEQ